VKFDSRGELCSLGALLTPLLNPRSQHSLMLRRMKGWTEVLDPYGPTSPLEANFANVIFLRSSKCPLTNVTSCEYKEKTVSGHCNII
jgi:hypothetical protein